MAEQSAKSFLDLLGRSGIVAEEQLKTVLADLSVKASGRVVATDELVSHLIESGLITQWHTTKLLAGKYKGFFLGKYKLLGHLGSGGMSSVYLAESKLSGQKRAIKVLPRKKVSDKSYLDRFYREGKAAASLSHPNVVRIYDICNEGDTHYMVMEYVKGSDLYERVKAVGALPIDEAVEHMIQASIGLQHAHAGGLVHRDIKPANLLHTDNGVVKILDLGLALFNQEDEESLTVLYNEKVMGTADYLSPEQAVNSHEVDLRADIYSLGCTLYFLLTGQPPFNKGTLAQRIAMHQTKKPDSIIGLRPECPPDLVAICERMMEKDPDDRYADCRQTQLALERFRANQAAQSDSPMTSGGGGVAQATKSQAKGSKSNSQQVKSSAEVKTDEFAASETLDDAPVAKSEFSIETGAESSGVDSVAAIPSVRRRNAKSAIPKWVLPSLIVVMLSLLVGVLYFVTSLM